MQSGHARRKAIVVGVVTLAVETVVVARRRGSLFAADTVVRCRSGHRFTTLWIPGVSLKSIRLGWWRFQYCPVGRHWSLVTPERVAGMTEPERLLAAEHHDVRIP